MSIDWLGRIEMKLLALMLILFANKAGALSVSPMTTEIHVTDPAPVFYQIKNENDGPLKVRLILQSRSTSLFGTELNEMSDSLSTDFSILPSEATLKNGESVKVCVTYSGKRNLQVERAYRLVVKVESVGKKESEKSVSMGLIFRTSIYLVPAAAKPNISLNKISEMNSDSLGLVFENNGGAHQLFNNVEIQIIDELGNSATVSEQQEPGLRINALSGEQRIVKIQRPKTLKGRNLVGKIVKLN
jgi:hypothetical protein